MTSKKMSFYYKKNYNMNKKRGDNMKISNVLWGLCLIALGVIFGLNALEITDIDIFFDGWWTLFIIVPCFIDLFKSEDKTGNIIGILIGVALLLSCQDIISFKLIMKLFFPVCLVLIGLSIIFKDQINGKIKKEMKKITKSEKEYSATFSSENISFENEKFQGCELSAVFGSINCNLRDANIKEDVIVEASAVFGEVEILVPEDVNVKVTSSSIFGGVSDKRKNKKTDSKVTIFIKASSIFGGIDIR